MTEDKRKHIESCFDSVEKLVSLRRTLTESLDSVTYNLDCAVNRLEFVQLDMERTEGEVELVKLDDTDTRFINGLYSYALWNTMQMLLPHFKTKVK